jgi:hypothetical protein
VEVGRAQFVCLLGFVSTTLSPNEAGFEVRNRRYRSPFRTPKYGKGAEAARGARGHQSGMERSNIGAQYELTEFLSIKNEVIFRFIFCKYE